MVAHARQQNAFFYCHLQVLQLVLINQDTILTVNRSIIFGILQLLRRFVQIISNVLVSQKEKELISCLIQADT